MIKKQDVSDFISGKAADGLEESFLFSFSQSISESEYFDLTNKFLRISDSSFYWSNPSEYFSFLAHGSVYSLSGNGIGKLPDFKDKLRNFPFKVISNDSSSESSAEPLFAGGIKFPSELSEGKWSDFNFVNFSIPQILLMKKGTDFKIKIHLFRKDIGELFSKLEFDVRTIPEKAGELPRIISNNSNADIEQWTESVHEILRQISPGKLNKVVLSRFNKIELNVSPDIFLQLQKLEINFNNCITFAYKSNDSVFFGSTPEKLFSIKNGFIETDALAGSAPRGANESEDTELKEMLLNDWKNLAEHKSVVDYILQKLTPLTEKILFDTQPSIKKYSNIQHLYSQIRAIPKSDISFFQILESLFPTPAVCGFPGREALSVINRLEDFDRGLFAGSLGWFNLNGDAEFSVGIRSALLKGKILYAYAGCGIVTGSDPVSEFNETELKLKPILNLFDYETVHKP